jgi:hypothetical protein
MTWRLAGGFIATQECYNRIARKNKIRNFQVDPDLARNIIEAASVQGVSVETYLRQIADVEPSLAADDPRIAALHEAMTDELFLSDLSEVMEDFQVCRLRDRDP